MKLKPQYKTLLGLRDLRTGIKSNPTYIEPKYIENIQGRVLLLDDWNKTPATWFDHSGTGNNGTVYGAGTPPAATPGALGYTFDGVDDYVDAGNAASLNITDAITVSAWVKFNNLNDRAILSKQYQTGNLPYHLKYGDNNIHFIIYISDTQYVASFYMTPDFGKWYHLIGTYDKGSPDKNLKVYVNGVLGSLIANYTGGLSINTLNVWIGRYGAEYFNGTIDEVRIWNRALNATEIQLLYMNPYNMFMNVHGEL